MMAADIPIDVNIIQTKMAVSLRFTAPKTSIPDNTPFERPSIICSPLPLMTPSRMVLFGFYLA